VDSPRQSLQAANYVGHAVKRLEDRPLLTGSGRFVADLTFPGMLEAAFVRSPHAHAAIRAVDTAAARQCAGVHAVLTFSDLAPLLAQERLPLQFRTTRLPSDITPLVLAKEEGGFVGGAGGGVSAQPPNTAGDPAASF